MITRRGNETCVGGYGTLDVDLGDTWESARRGGNYRGLVRRGALEHLKEIAYVGLDLAENDGSRLER